jgi:hypothetical protein
VFPTWGSGASWPACRPSRRTRRKVVDCVYMYLHVVLHTHSVLSVKTLQQLSGGGLSVWYMNRWNKQHVDGGTRTNRTKWATWAEAWRGSQSSPRTRLKWTYSRGATEDSRSSMYECDTENHDVALRLLVENVMYVNGCVTNLLFFCR